MEPVQLKLEHQKSFLAICNEQSPEHLISVFSYTYSIYRDTDLTDMLAVERQNDYQFEDDPFYTGCITIELPGKQITYTNNGLDQLTSDEYQAVASLLFQHIATQSLQSV